MKKVLAMIALLAMTITAGAKTQEIAHFGYWHVFEGTSSEGQAMCGMQTSFYNSPEDKAAGRFSKSVHVKYWAGAGAIVVQLFKSTWRIPENAPLRLTVGFDSGEGININTWGDSTKTPGLEMSYIPFHFKAREHIAKFLEDFAHSDRMWIKFLDGNEPEWNLDMVGSRDASRAFQECILRIPNPQSATR